MTDEHKQALAEGRAQGRAVKAYLEAVVATKPRPGRKRTADSIRRRLDAIEAELADAAPLAQLQLVQERMDLQSELAAMETAVDLSELEKAFVEVAAGYGKRKGISYQAWREVGVNPDVLKKAGIGKNA